VRFRGGLVTASKNDNSHNDEQQNTQHQPDPQESRRFHKSSFAKLNIQCSIAFDIG
jgi:hypothetical protein